MTTTEPTPISKRNGVSLKTKVKTPLDEKISEMNATALAADNANLRERVAKLEASYVALAHGVSNQQRLVQGQAVTIAAAHHAGTTAQTHIDAHIRDHEDE